MAEGYLALVLHAHLPFVRHPEYDSFLEENWFFEAITDTYVPIINVLDGLIDDGVDFRLTISLSPTLICMLKDELLISRYLRHIDKLIKLATLEVERTKSDERFNKLAVEYLEKFKAVKFTFFEKYQSNILTAFKKLQDVGKLEIITCAATHAYLPFLDIYKPAVKAQIKVAVDIYKDVFGSSPKGMWLPECAYTPGHDEILGECGIRYFFVETHGIMFSTPRPRYGVYSGYLCPSGVGVFGRDGESSKAVWSSKEGYPGDYNYREYYRDIGFDLDYEYVKPFINGCGNRINTGIKYHRITGDTDNKDVYDSVKAASTANKHAEDFMASRINQMNDLTKIMDRKPLVVAPYDAELFGHWWFEGPLWLDSLLRKIYHNKNQVETITPSEYMLLYDKFQVLTPSMSSWGYKGYSEVWLNGSNDWEYRHIHKITELMIDAARDYKGSSGIEARTLNQMARELLLAQSSDWAFMLKTGTFVDYASGRIKVHINNFMNLHNALRENTIDLNELAKIEEINNIFTNIDYNVYGE